MAEKPKRKGGQASDFQGKRLEFLLRVHPEHLEASTKSKTREIWPKIFKDYWALFPWRLPLKQDPDEGDTTNYSLSPQNTEEENGKKEMMPAMETGRCETILGHLGLLGFASLQEADAEHELLVEKHEDAMGGQPALDEEGMEDARTRFSDLVGPLLDGLAAHTGYDITILAGRVKKDGVRLDIESLTRGCHIDDESRSGLFQGKRHCFRRCDAELLRNSGRASPRHVNGRESGQSLHINVSRTNSVASCTNASLSIAPAFRARAGGGVNNFYRSASEHLHRRRDYGTSRSPRSHDFNFDFLLPNDLLGVGPLPLGGSVESMGLEALPLNPYETGFAARLSSELIMMVEELPIVARAERVDELRKMDAKQLEAENNTARNYYMLHALQLGEPQKETLWGGAVSPAPKRKRADGTAAKGKAKGKRARKSKDPVLVSESEGPSTTEDEEDAPVQPKPRPKPRPVPRQMPMAPSGSTIEVKAWAKTAREFLSSGDLGSNWTALVDVWWNR
ncbi:hypothetical protein K438DRAFT_1994619 [Mycena galopus ATCC 62051]|nr:hypothetical protein K438DRAFT_1994619 [Mycena galopus ATCC 62051]